MTRRFVAIAPLVVAFYCLWQAETMHIVQPFSHGQWRLLGWSALAVGGWLALRRDTPAR